MSEEITESVNTDTSTATPTIEKSGGDMTVSFDDLDAVESSQQRSAQLEVKKKAEAEKAVKDEIKEQKKSVPKKEEKAAASDPKKDQKEASEDSSDPSETEELPEVSLYKVRNGNDDIELRADTKISVPIDGEDVEVTIDELRRGYSGQQYITQTLQNMSAEKKEFYEDRESFDNMVSEIFDNAQDNPYQTLVKIAEKAGLDPVEYQMSLLDGLAEQAEAWKNMTEEEKSAFKLGLENEQYKTRLEKAESTREYEQSYRELESKVESIERELGISREEFTQMYNDVTAHFQRSGYDVEITPEIVAEFFVQNNNQEIARSILEEVNPELADDQEKVDLLLDTYEENPEFSFEDLKEMAQEAWGGNKKAKKISQKLAKGKPDRVASKQPIDPQKNPISFDELDYL